MHASTYVKELSAIMAAIKNWCQYLLGHPFAILTDHKSLKELMTQVVQTPEQHMYLARLMGYDYTIHYRSGALNVVVDVLSRIPKGSSGMLLSFSVLCCTFLEELKQHLANDTEFVAMSQSITNNPTTYPEYTVSQDLILHKGCIWLPKSSSFTPILLTKYHASPTGGHMGVTKTLARLSDNFTWTGIQKDVERFIIACVDCQHTKYESHEAVRLLCPLPVPFHPWEDLSMDFIVDLPPYQGNNTILVVVDRFSKGIHLGVLPSNHTFLTVASLFMDIVGKPHGMPKSLVSDRDPLFIIRF